MGFLRMIIQPRAAAGARVTVELQHVRVERRGDVALVRIDRPPANALDPVLLSEGARCVEELAAEPPAPSC